MLVSAFFRKYSIATAPVPSSFRNCMSTTLLPIHLSAPNDSSAQYPSSDWTVSSPPLLTIDSRNGVVELGLVIDLQLEVEVVGIVEDADLMSVAAIV
jgi:hypothetical protein